MQEEKPSISGTQKLVTEFTKEMFISNNSHHDIKKDHGMDSTLDESIGYRDDIGEDLKSELELSDDSKLGDTPVLSTLVPLEAGNVSSGKLLKNCLIMYTINESCFR